MTSGKATRSLERFYERIKETGHILLTFACGHCGEKQHQIVKADKRPACINCGKVGP